MMSIYVAGGSQEIRTVEKYVKALRTKFEIAHDWCAEVRRQEALGVPPNPRNVGLFTLLRWASDDLSGATSCDFFWLLVPKPESLSIGCWVEFGAALTRFPRPKTVIVSGDWRCTVFAASADRRFTEHQDAFNWLIGGLVPRSEEETAA